MNTIFYIERGRKKTPILSKFICVDDYGSAVFLCHYTGLPVNVTESIIAGNIVPQAKAAYVVRQGTEELEKESRRLFHESEANCNMCKNFHRLPYDKKQFAISGVFYGTCVAHKKLGEFMVAPDDWMGMDFWMPRD